jgi:hypothetical protein
MGRHGSCSKHRRASRLNLQIGLGVFGDREDRRVLEGQHLCLRLFDQGGGRFGDYHGRRERCLDPARHHPGKGSHWRRLFMLT